MGEARDDPRIFLVEPEQRGIIPLDRFHVPTRLKRTVRADSVTVRVDTAFDAVLDACAASGPGREDSWINAPIRRLYIELNARGQAHSIECWRDETLVGGLYGVTLGGAFFGESMFSRERDASKIALVHLVARLIAGGYMLLDAQFQTDHLSQFGTREIERESYQAMLGMALYASFVKFWPYDLSFSWRHYQMGLFDAEVGEGFVNSLLMASGTAVFGTALVFVGAYLLAYTWIARNAARVEGGTWAGQVQDGSLALTLAGVAPGWRTTLAYRLGST